MALKNWNVPACQIKHLTGGKETDWTRSVGSDEFFYNKADELPVINLGFVLGQEAAIAFSEVGALEEEQAGWGDTDGVGRDTLYYRAGRIDLSDAGTLTDPASATDLWTQSSTNADLYYYTGDSLSGKPAAVFQDDVEMTEGSSLESLNKGEWGWGNIDSLSEPTIYINIGYTLLDAGDFSLNGDVTSGVFETYYYDDFMFLSEPDAVKVNGSIIPRGDASGGTLSQGSYDIHIVNIGYDFKTLRIAMPEIDLVVDGESNWTQSSTIESAFYYTGSHIPVADIDCIAIDNNVTSDVQSLTGGTVDEKVGGSICLSADDGQGSESLYVYPTRQEVTTSDQFVQGSTVTAEWYYTGSLDHGEPAAVVLNGTTLTKGTVGSLAEGEWGWGDNDSIGNSTVYVRTANSDSGRDLGDATTETFEFVWSPDAYASGYVKAVRKPNFPSGAGVEILLNPDLVFVRGSEFGPTSIGMIPIVRRLQNPGELADGFLQMPIENTVVQKQPATECILLSMLVSNYSTTKDARVWFLNKDKDGNVKFQWIVDMVKDASPFALEAKQVLEDEDNLCVISTGESVAVLVSGDEE